jgi:hypothetical protein
MIRAGTLQVTGDQAMKTRTQILASVLMTTLASGCGTTSDIQSGGDDVASILGVEQSEIRFSSYCYYAEIRKLEKKTVQYSQGILAFTTAQLLLSGGDLRTTSPSKEIQVPISEIEGVDLREYEPDGSLQLQVIYGEYLLVIVVTSDKAWVDREGSQKLHDLLVAEGVPQWQSEQIYKEDGPFFIIPDPPLDPRQKF